MIRDSTQWAKGGTFSLERRDVDLRINANALMSLDRGNEAPCRERIDNSCRLTEFLRREGMRTFKKRLARRILVPET